MMLAGGWLMEGTEFLRFIFVILRMADRRY
jgi:hypothetical protein